MASLGGGVVRVQELERVVLQRGSRDANETLADFKNRILLLINNEGVLAAVIARRLSRYGISSDVFSVPRPSDVGGGVG